MGSVICHTAVAENNEFSAIENTAMAALKCIEGSGIDPSRIGVLIYAGVYRDDNIMEPSVASLVQKKIHLGLDVSQANFSGMTFSFDIINGANSVLNAIAVADSLLQNSPDQHVLIVAGDAHPSKTDHAEFPFVAIGAAMLLAWDKESSRGFQSISYLSDDKSSESGFSATGKLEEFGSDGRSHVRFESDQEYLSNCMQLSVENINRYLTEQQPSAIDFLLGSDPVSTFSHQLISFLNYQPETNKDPAASLRTINLYEHFGGDVHTAAPIAAFNLLFPELNSRRETTLLFSTVGSGNASACVLYRV